MTPRLADVPAWQELLRASQYVYLPNAVETVNPGTIDTLVQNLSTDDTALTEAGTILWYVLRDLVARTEMDPVDEGNIHSWLRPFSQRILALGKVDIVSAEYAVRTVLGLADIVSELGVDYFVRCAATILFASNTRPESWMEHYTLQQDHWLPGDAL